MNRRVTARIAEPVISVVVTAHNAAETIQDCLRSVAGNLGAEPDDVEIILVDDRSTDVTADAARALALECLRILRIDSYQDRSLTARQIALDLGFRSARGEVILVTDADAIVPQDWIPRMAEPIKAGTADIVAGPFEFRAGSAFLRGLQNVEAAFYFALNRDLNRLGLESAFCFGNLAFRRGIYEQSGGFNAIGFTLTEDLAFSRRLHRLGFRSVFQKGPGVSVQACSGWTALIRRSARVTLDSFSLFSLLLWAWLLSLPVLLVLALAVSQAFLPWFALRFGIGAGFLAYSLASARKFSLLPLVFICEPMAVFIGIWVKIRHFTNRTVEWGGIEYAR
jgi:cellulose synthase/poly-beta-1,6-N-acetylglucosamine synthase-like glycosyltransferase